MNAQAPIKQRKKKKPHTPAIPTEWDRGADGPAARARPQLVEGRGELNPKTGKVENPNNVRGVRYLTVAGLYHARGLISARQLRAADALRQAWEQKDRSPPAIQEAKVDHSPKPDDRTAMVVDRAMKYVRMSKHVPEKYAAFINHVARDDKHITSMPGYRRGVYMDRLRLGLDEMADRMGY